MRPALLVLVGLAACGYQAPPRTDTASPAFAAARDACEDSAAKQVNQRNAKTGLAWMASPVRRWSQIGDATAACMDGKGFGRVRWCTPEELRNGNRQNGLIVTASGIQCSDPPGLPSERPADTSPPASAPTGKAGTRLLR